MRNFAGLVVVDGSRVGRGMVGESQRAIPMFRPHFAESDFAAISGVLASGMVAHGVTARLFETNVAERVGSEAALTTSSGTTAASLAFAALGIGPIDEVRTPSLTCLGVVNAISRTGATPQTSRNRKLRDGNDVGPPPR
jgi:dTDP-4-amino-4,6-dideoxygalactose transaminase